MAFLGLRGSGDWTVVGQRPQDYREGMLFLYPNGSLPLTAITSKMASQKCTDPQYHWFMKTLPSQEVAKTGAYTDQGLTSAYDGSGATDDAGKTVYIKMALADVKNFKVGHVVLAYISTDHRYSCVMLVTDVVQNGASSYIRTKLLENDDNLAGKTIADADYVCPIGSAYGENDDRPAAISYDATKGTNYTQIFRNSLEESRTAMETKLRTGDSYKEMKRETLELHGIEMEKAFLFGVASEDATGGQNGKPLRTTDGLITFLRNANVNIFDYPNDASGDFTGKAWTAEGGGEDWIDKCLEQIFRYGKQEKMAFCGNGVVLAINRIAKARGTWNFTSKTVDYGLKVIEWVSPFGVIYLKTHPLFNHTKLMRNGLVIFEPSNIKYRFITDTTFKPDPGLYKSGASTKDGISEEFLTEAGLEFHFPETGGLMTGFGSAHA